jgi:hypothetical protein
MRTKTLLLSAAALVAGVVASQAQSNVYSANVVGYVNSYVNNQFSLVATPLDDGANSTNNGSNDLNTLLGTLPNKASVQIWNPGTATFTGATKLAAGWSPNFSVPPGTGYFLKLNSGTGTNTFVGQVTVQNTQSVSNTLPANLFSLVGSPIPYADNLNDPSNYLGLGTNNASIPNKSSIQVWNAGTQTFSGTTKLAAGWSPDVTIAPGQGFFIKTPSTATWVQTLNLQ